MPDREIVCKALKCIAEDRQKSCIGCEYSIFGLYPFCAHNIAKDALSLLKEQEVKEQISDAIHEMAKKFRQTQEGIRKENNMSGPFYVKDEKSKFVLAKICADCGFCSNEEGYCCMLKCIFFQEYEEYEEDGGDES